MQITEKDIVEGLRVHSPRHTNGVCTGEIRNDGFVRAHVIWPGDVHRWPLIAILRKCD